MQRMCVSAWDRVSMQTSGDQSLIDLSNFKRLAPFEQRALLVSAKARSQLALTDRMYWFKLRHKRFLGYRRNEEVGQWRARVYEKSRYIYLNIGFADEGPTPKGREHYSFREAVDITTRFAENPKSTRRKRRTDTYPAFELIASPVGDEMSVLKAVSLYLASLDGRATHGYLAHLYRSMNRHVIPGLGNMLCDELTVPIIRHWFDDLNVGPLNPLHPIVRVPGGPRFSEDDKEEHRAKEAANRVMIHLRSVLNFAWHEGLISGYARPWQRVCPYRASRRKVPLGLSQEECSKLIKCCPPDLRLLVLAALFTGARLSELRTLKRSAFDFPSGTLLIYATKVRKARRVVLSFEAIDFFEFLTLPLQPNDFILRKADGEPWVSHDHTHMFRQACLAAGIDRRLVFHELRHTYASHQIMAGVSPFVIADQLGHRDCSQLFRTYGHVSTSFAQKQIRNLTPSYVLRGGLLDAVAQRHAHLAEHRRRPKGPLALSVLFGQVADWSKPVT